MKYRNFATIFSLLFLSGCVSVDVIHPKKISEGNVLFKQGEGQVVDTRGRLWSGIVLNLGIPLPPLIIPYGRETTRVWRKDGQVIYTEKTDSRAQGLSCSALIIKCGYSTNVGSWGDLLFNESGMYH